MTRYWHRHYWVPIGVVACAALLFGAWYGVHLLDPGPTAHAATLPTSVRYRTLPGHTVTKLKRVRVPVVRYRHGKRIVTYRTVTRPVSVFVPPHTVAVTVTRTGRTIVRTVIHTVTTSGSVTTIRVPTTITGPTTTLTGPTVTGPTTTVTGPTTTITCNVDTNGATIGCS